MRGQRQVVKAYSKPQKGTVRYCGARPCTNPVPENSTYCQNHRQIDKALNAVPLFAITNFCNLCAHFELTQADGDDGLCSECRAWTKSPERECQVNGHDYFLGFIGKCRRCGV